MERMDQCFQSAQICLEKLDKKEPNLRKTNRQLRSPVENEQFTEHKKTTTHCRWKKSKIDE